MSTNGAQSVDEGRSGNSNSTLQITTHDQYTLQSPLATLSSLKPDPLALFREWFANAQSKDPKTNHSFVHEPEAFTLSTIAANDDPSRPPIPNSRVVLLKRVTQGESAGFTFFTNYESPKSLGLKSNPWCSMVFYWRELNRSVRVVGKAEKVDRNETEEYFRTRPVGSKIGAWASVQSSALASDVKPGSGGSGGREVLEERTKEVEKRFGVREGSTERVGEGGEEEANKDIAPPEFWGGWKIVPEEVEFWAGRPNRLHDRFRYRRNASSQTGWTIDRLSP